MGKMSVMANAMGSRTSTGYYRSTSVTIHAKCGRTGSVDTLNLTRRAGLAEHRGTDAAPADAAWPEPASRGW